MTTATVLALNPEERTVLMTLSNWEDYVALGEIDQCQESTIKAGRILLALRTLVSMELAEPSEIGWRWRCTVKGRKLIADLIRESMNTKGEHEERQI